MFDFPECDKDGVPTKKMPDCPACKADELGLIHPRCVFCYNCGWKWDKGDPWPGNQPGKGREKLKVSEVAT